MAEIVSAIRRSASSYNGRYMHVAHVHTSLGTFVAHGFSLATKLSMHAVHVDNDISACNMHVHIHTWHMYMYVHVLALLYII